MALTRFYAALYCIVLFVAGSASAADIANIRTVLDTYQAQSGIPVASLGDTQLARLAAGDVVYRKASTTRRSNDGDVDSTILRIIGYRVIEHDRERLWLAALAFDAGYSRRLTEHHLGYDGHGGASWYQHVNMPWPLRNRHWLIETGKNIALANDTDNRIWEHHWRLVDDVDTRIRQLFVNGDVTVLPDVTPDNAIILPLNNGAWVMAELDATRTLIILHATMDMGGLIPDRLVASYTRRQLDNMLLKIERDAATAWQRYNADYIIYRGDGTTIAPPAVTAGKATTP